MGKVLLTLFYHPQEAHANLVGQELEKEELDSVAVTHAYSRSNGKSPSVYLRERAVEHNCDHILIVHSDPELNL